MPRYLFIANYAPEGAEALLQSGGSVRRSSIEKAAASLGGTVQSFDFALGGDDVYVIAELADQHAAAAMSLTVNAAGVARLRTVVLMSPEELDAVSGLRADYTPAGRSS
jgi:uncharacterized protein with GYD domain